MIDFSETSLQEFIFASRTRNSPVGKQRHLVDAFRTVCWFKLLKRNTGATTIDQMRSCLEVKSASDDDKRDNGNKKWQEYSWGRRTPNPELSAQIDALHPGSRVLLNHLLWDVLRFERPITKYGESWLSRLHPEIQTFIFPRNALLGSEKKTPVQLNNMHFSMLERRASLDTLACLVILIRQSANAGNEKQTDRLCYRACRMLLILAPIFSNCGVLRPFSEYFEQNVLPLGELNQMHYAFWDKGLPRAARMLWTAANNYEADENRVFTTREQISLRMKTLDYWRLDDCFNFIIRRAQAQESESACVPGHFTC